MSNKLPMDKIRKRVREYLERVPGVALSSETASDVVGMSRFVDVDNLPDLEDLPPIPERMRDFAFRYVTEHKPNRLWAKEYGITECNLYSCINSLLLEKG